MKIGAIFKFIAVSLIALQANANLDGNKCVSYFDSGSEKNNHETETQKGARHFHVKDYANFKGKELDLYLRDLKNFNEFVQGIPFMNSMFTAGESVPREGFYIANQVFPLIEAYLTKHGVKFRVEAYEENTYKRSIIIIEEMAPAPQNEAQPNILNQIAHVVGTQQKILLVIKPIDLFFPREGREIKSYTEVKGEVSDLDINTEVYSMSPRMLIDTQVKGFNINNLAKADGQLLALINDSLIHRAQGPQQENVSDALLDGETKTREDSQAQHRKQQEEKIRQKIEAAKNQK